MKLPRRNFLHRAAVAASATAALIIPTRQVWSKTYPSRPITIVEPFGASSVPDILARIMAPNMSKALGQPVVVENVVGAGGMIGVSRVAHASPDGYHIVITSVSAQAYSQTLYKEPLYNSVTDFAPIMLLSEQPLLLVTSNNLPVKNLREFISYAKANQAKMQFGSLAGTGSANHVVCLLFNKTIGVKVTHVPYRPPSSTAYQDLIAGRIGYLCPLASGDAKAHIEGEHFRGIAVFSNHRSPIMPDVPTADEQGLSGFEGKVWNAFFAPKGTPAPVIQKLHDAINDAADAPEIRSRLEAYGAELVSPERRSPEYLQGFLKSEIKKWGAVIKAAGIIVQ
jgi:tripartite-type tricarboxylate transporter receptor subunit TctC